MKYEKNVDTTQEQLLLFSFLSVQLWKGMILMCYEVVNTKSCIEFFVCKSKLHLKH